MPSASDFLLVNLLVFLAFTMILIVIVWLGEPEE